MFCSIRNELTLDGAQGCLWRGQVLPATDKSRYCPRWSYPDSTTASGHAQTLLFFVSLPVLPFSRKYAKNGADKIWTG